jgi:hypothetical protein
MMNCISWTDAFLIIKRWRDNQSLVLFGWLGMSGDVPASKGTTSLISSVDLASGSISNSNGESFDLLGASFEYTDSRDSPLNDSFDRYDEFIEVELRDGKWLTLAAMKDV